MIKGRELRVHAHAHGTHTWSKWRVQGMHELAPL